MRCSTYLNGPVIAAFPGSLSLLLLFVNFSFVPQFAGKLNSITQCCWYVINLKLLLAGPAGHF
jgi:hypothetical protein